MPQWLGGLVVDDLLWTNVPLLKKLSIVSVLNLHIQYLQPITYVILKSELKILKKIHHKIGKMQYFNIFQNF